MRERIGSHYVNDRDDLYRFVRNSRLPRGTFDDDHMDRVVLVVCVLCLLLALLLVNLYQ